MKMIQVQTLTKAAFAPYGEMLTVEGREAGGNPNSHFWYPQVAVIDAPTSINLMRVVPRPFIIKDFEAHVDTSENLIAMNGDLIVAVADKGDLKAENVAAFYVPCGLGVSLAPSVWHYVPFPMGRDVMCACIFKNGTSTNDIYFKSLPEEIGLTL